MLDQFQVQGFDSSDSQLEHVIRIQLIDNSMNPNVLIFYHAYHSLITKYIDTKQPFLL